MTVLLTLRPARPGDGRTPPPVARGPAARDDTAAPDGATAPDGSVAPDSTVALHYAAAPDDSAALDACDAGATGVLGRTGPAWHARTAADPDRAHLVLDDGRALAGYLVLAAPRGPERGVELHRLVIAPPWRGAGVGRALLRAVLDLTAVPDRTGSRPAGSSTGARPATGNGAPPAPAPDVVVDPAWTTPGWLPAGRLWLEVDPGNGPALALYRSAGLVVEARLPTVPGDPDSATRRLVLSRG
ncbi:GNAT family N-acetyltransferase [Pseudonocardia nematodicida]|uniref:GNAT family N-acetyltransferase n=1 Tax=Pseudonocardia nematodicida TaxID=1206997 RepID=A0ABV1KDA2_9PSEU